MCHTIKTPKKEQFPREKVLSYQVSGEFKSEADSDLYEIITLPSDLETVKNVLKEKNITVESAEVTMVPQTQIALKSDNAKNMLKLMDALEEHDDVKNIYANFDISDEDMEKLNA